MSGRPAAGVRILAVIPARWGASRLPGKPLADLAGKPLVQRVWEAARSCPSFSAVVVATDDERIASVARAFGADVELTSPDHPTGTDRVAEVAGRHPDADVVVNVQGDQPFADAASLTALVQPYLDGERPPMTTLGCPLDAGLVDDPDTVKVVCDLRGDALYFSRAAIPHVRGEAPPGGGALHHLGLYAFTREALLALAGLPPTPLERAEVLEQLRALENGVRIRVCRTDRAVLEVNTEDDRRRAAELLAEVGP